MNHPHAYRVCSPDHPRYQHRRAVLVALLMAAMLLALAVFLGACAAPGPAYDAMVRGADTFARVTAGPRLERYYANDPNLSQDERVSFLGELRAFQEATAAARREREAELGGPP